MKVLQKRRKKCKMGRPGRYIHMPRALFLRFYRRGKKKCKMGRPGRHIHMPRIVLGAGDVLNKKTMLPFIMKRYEEISALNVFRDVPKKKCYLYASTKI